MATFAALKATKAFKTGSKAVKSVNKAGETIENCQTYFQYGQSILSLFGIGGGPTNEDVLNKLDQMHTDMLAGFKSIENRLDELQLANTINLETETIDFYYTRINEINEDYPDPDARDYQLRQLLLKGTDITVLSDIMQCIYTVKRVMLGEQMWTISIPEKSIGAIIADAEVEKAGEDRFQYMSAAVQYYSYNLVYLYEGLFVVNFIEAYFDQSSATQNTQSPNIVQCLDRINQVEDESPLPTYQPYFEMRIHCARPPESYSGNTKWVLFSSGEYMIYDLGTHTITEGPYRLSSTVNPPPAGFRAIPPEYYYADAVYNHRTKPGLTKYDDYYYFFKGKNYTCLFWDNSSIKRSGTIPSELSCKRGVFAAMCNPHNNKCYLFYNERTTIYYHITCTDRNWYEVSSPSWQGYKTEDGPVDGGGGLPNESEKMVTFCGRNAYRCVRYDHTRSFSDEYSCKVWEYLPAIAEKVWHIKQMMDRDA